jgi:hypothetical protein
MMGAVEFVNDIITRLILENLLISVSSNHVRRALSIISILLLCSMPSAS